MAIEVVCGACGADYSVPESLLGKVIKCKACSGPMSVAAASPAPAKPAVARPIAAKPAKPAKPAVVAEDEDDDYDDEPVTPRGGRGNGLPAAKKKSTLPLILLGLGGLTAVLAVVVGGVVLSGVFDEKPKPFAFDAGAVPVVTPPPAANALSKPAANALAQPAADARPDAEAPRPSTLPPKTKPQVVPPASAKEETPDEEPKKAILVTPLPPRKEKPSADPIAPAGPRTTMDQVTIDRVKKATVYIEVEMDNGGGSGSGWFGMEQNLIFTNAHVLSMTAPNAAKPKKITVYISPGTSKERVLPHAKLEIIAVDRFADLAILRVLNETDLPTPLKIRPSAELRDVEPLVVIGYPKGRGMSAMTSNTKAPQATVNLTNFSTNRLDDEGNLYWVQIRGGASPGNSGGPIVDYDGNVVAITVAVPTDVNLAANVNYGVPTEMVTGLLAGRVADVEYGQAYRKGGKVRVPVKVNVLDPFQRMKEVGVGGWVGDPSDKNRAPGPDRTGVEPSDSPLAETKLAYVWAKDKQVATGEIEFPELQAGRSFWAQPFYKNTLVSTYWMPGRQVVMAGPPVDIEDADLTARLKVGSRRATTLLTSGYVQEFLENERSEPEDKNLGQTEIKATETVEKTNDSSAVVQLRLNYEALNFKEANVKGEREDTLSKRMPKEYRDALSQNIKLIQGFGFVRRDGSVYKSQSDLRNSAPLFSGLFRLFSDNAMRALEGASVPLPNKKVSPNFTWKSERNDRITNGFTVDDEKKGDAPTPGGPGSGRPKVAMKAKEYKFVEEVTYTYLGTRTRVGQKEAVIRVDGVIKPAAGTSTQGGASGSIKGYAYIDLDTGTVLESELRKEFEMDSSSDGARKVIAGLRNYKVTRGTAQGQ